MANPRYDRLTFHLLVGGVVADVPRDLHPRHVEVHPVHDELYRPTPPRFGDAGQGSSRQAPPPQDNDSSDDDGSDYTQMYSRFGM
jgi:hypothetical protein